MATSPPAQSPPVEEECSYKLAVFGLGVDASSVPRGPERMMTISKSAVANHNDTVHTVGKKALGVFTSWLADDLPKERLWTEDWCVILSSLHLERGTPAVLASC